MRIKHVAGSFLLSLGFCSSLIAGTKENCQDSLRFSIIPLKNMEQLIDEYQPLANLLSDNLKMPVKIVPASSYESVIDAIISSGTDIARMGPASYLRAWQMDPEIEPFVSLVSEPKHFTPEGNYYNSILVVLNNSNIDSVADVKNKRVALGDPASTSGAIIPMQEFAAITDMPTYEYFSGQVFTGSHEKSLDALLQKRVDAAFVSSSRADEYLRRGLIKKDTLKVLWHSTPIYYDPLVFSRTLCKELKDKVRNVLTDPTATAGLESFFRSQQAIGFAPVSHEAYESLLPLITEYKHKKSP